VGAVSGPLRGQLSGLVTRPLGGSSVIVVTRPLDGQLSGHSEWATGGPAECVQ
jgi:hypothetical protein